VTVYEIYFCYIKIFNNIKEAGTLKILN